MPRILVVDDDTPIREMLVDVLLDEGYVALSARNGKIGVELARRHQPHLVLMDIMMPELDGAAAIERLRSDPATRAIRVIAMSAASTLLNHVDQLQADAVIAKPFDIDELLASIELHLRGVINA